MAPPSAESQQQQAETPPGAPSRDETEAAGKTTQESVSDPQQAGAEEPTQAETEL